jgi:hypothetical protein
MSLLPGVPLSAPISPAQTGALTAALDALWRPVPQSRLIPPFAPVPNAVVLAGRVRSMAGTARPPAGTTLEAADFTGRFSLTAAERAALREYRRLAALFWLGMLLPGGPASARNPPGTLHQQARRLLTLLG